MFGFPVVDVRVTCFDGKYHSVDSSEMSFKMAGSIGFKEAMAKAEPILLEPVSELVVHRARGATRATSWATSTPSAAASRGRARSGNGEVEIVALVPDVGDPALHDRPALDDRRPRPLHARRTRTTTRCPRTSSSKVKGASAD